MAELFLTQSKFSEQVGGGRVRSASIHFLRVCDRHIIYWICVRVVGFLQRYFLMAQSEPSSRLPLYSLVLFPPMSLGTLNPSIFFTALDYTGTFSISVLGGIIPALMSWKQRQEQENLNT